MNTALEVCMFGSSDASQNSSGCKPHKQNLTKEYSSERSALELFWGNPNGQFFEKNGGAGTTLEFK